MSQPRTTVLTLGPEIPTLGAVIAMHQYINRVRHITHTVGTIPRTGNGLVFQAQLQLVLARR